MEPPRGRPEPRHAAREALECLVDKLEDARVVRVRLQEAERLVEADKRAGVADRAAREALEQLALLLLILGRVAGGGCRQGLDDETMERIEGSEP